MTPDEQLREWVAGNPMHNTTRDECTPDFSCCRGREHMADEDVRRRFMQAHEAGDRETEMRMLGMFLGAAFSGVYVADGSAGNEH